ncbi:Hypothetical predicted protein [Mytilus galloprovincialis]|uniref:Uncharacterized protein n=1 Tax=Mytilus galloprovincialis TaxID=29158 RepID=A0A8B6CN99_MYTGA|nr:Hypothetical predicted protein [Mytilus galloprovincialis]
MTVKSTLTMKVVLILLAVFNNADFVTAWYDFVGFGACSTIHDVTEDHSYEMTWNGDTHFSGCRVSFHGYSDDLDKYKICIRATIWNVKDAGVTLKYYSGSSILSTYIQKTYTKYGGDPTFQWCSDQDDYVDIELSTGSLTSSNQGQITLDVTAVKTYTYYSYTGTIGGSVAGAVFFVVLCVIFGVVCRRRVYARSITTYGSPNQATTVITQSGSQQMGGFPNPGYPTGPASPPPYAPPPNTGYPAPQHGYSNQQQYPPPPYPQTNVGQPQYPTGGPTKY